MFLTVAVFDHAELFAHSPLANHLPCDAGRLFDVAAGTVGDVTENDFLGNATTP